MGYLFHHDLQAYNDKFNLTAFVESGLHTGNGVKHALNFGYKSVNSIELLDQFYNSGMELFKDEARVHLFKGNTVDRMPDVLSSIDLSDNILFWLDAHIPSHYQGGTYDHETEFPLEKELNIIKNNRQGKDVFIIDDLRIYKVAPFQDGNYYGRISDNIDFIHNILGDTHDITEDYRDQGYIIVTPKMV